MRWGIQPFWIRWPSVPVHRTAVSLVALSDSVTMSFVDFSFDGMGEAYLLHLHWVLQSMGICTPRSDVLTPHIARGAHGEPLRLCARTQESRLFAPFCARPRRKPLLDSSFPTVTQATKVMLSRHTSSRKPTQHRLTRSSPPALAQPGGPTTGLGTRIDHHPLGLRSTTMGVVRQGGALSSRDREAEPPASDVSRLSGGLAFFPVVPPNSPRRSYRRNAAIGARSSAIRHSRRQEAAVSYHPASPI